MRTLMICLAKAKKGVTAIEYGLIAGAIAIAIIGGVGLLGTDLSTLFVTVQSEVSKVKTAGS